MMPEAGRDIRIRSDQQGPEYTRRGPYVVRQARALSPSVLESSPLQTPTLRVGGIEDTP